MLKLISQCAATWLLTGVLATAAAQIKVPWNGTDLSGNPCIITHGEASFGAYDYTNPRHVSEYLGMVENHHFTSDVEHLIRGKSASIYADIVYTLKAFPNHHRALNSLVRYKLKGGRNITTPPECWLDRALAFAREDKTVYIVYGIYLYKLKEYDKAIEKLRAAEALPGDNVEVYYNLGLLHVKTGDVPIAAEYAEKAYSLGYPLQGLRKQLEARGYSLPN